MDIKTKQEDNQEVFTKDTEKKTRAERRRQAKAEEKARRQADKGKKSKPSVQSQRNEELLRRADEIMAGLKARTWRELETNGKFTKNDKLTFISDDMLIIGCDIGSEVHYIRGIDTRGRELSRDAYAFSNNEEGFQNAKNWAVELAAANDKKQIVLGLEPTGHYWFCLAAWMVSNGISVVQVNPYAVKQTKELEDNSQRKDDRKDPKLIANLVKDGNYGMPYLPEGVYADLRRLSMFRDQLTEDKIRNVNRIHRELKIYFPEYQEAFGKLDGAFTLAVLKNAPFPEDILDLGADGIRGIWKEAGLKGGGYSRADKIVRCAEGSIGLADGTGAGKMAVKWFAGQTADLAEELKEVEKRLYEKCTEIPSAVNILDIPGIGEKILSGILAEMGDISRFDDVREIQKLGGMGLVACSSGKHKGETKISHRGRKRLRYWLFQAAKSAVAHSAEFKAFHIYYTTRAGNPLKKMQSLVVIACKVLRVIYAILKNGTEYDPAKMMQDIKHPVDGKTAAA